MYSLIYSGSTYGVDAFTVEIETHLDNAVPAFAIVGLPDSSVKESRERVTAAIKNSSFAFPSKKITVNLAPADVRKEGSGFDLPIALGVLTSVSILPRECSERTIFLGELALDGSLRPVHGALPISIRAARDGFKRIVLPVENSEEAALVGGIDSIPVRSLEEAVKFITGELDIAPCKVDLNAIFEQVGDVHQVDLSDVKGQENVKRAIEIAAAGGHNMLMIGPPGSGKTMIAKRISTVLPPLTLEEALETTKIHSIAGMLGSAALITRRPFRSPHHTISDAALVGGGVNKIRPGEISLAHHGVLFMDELPEFARNVLEVLRQPLEDKRITISRTKMNIDYPANFMLVCSMNPCPCGNFNDPTKECSCTSTQIKRYLSRISGPLLDRIDLHVEVPAVKYQDLSSKRVGEKSVTIRDRVVEARKRQIKRFEGEAKTFKNSDMSSKQMRKYCVLDDASQSLLKMAIEKLGFSARAYDRIIKIARTIADLAGSENIRSEHVSEAIQYRSLDRDYWNGI
ncbi:MAG: YifB family Mg chelatase-like AAA ATPase [Chloroflexota bacterium]